MYGNHEKVTGHRLSLRVFSLLATLIHETKVDRSSPIIRTFIFVYKKKKKKLGSPTQSRESSDLRFEFVASSKVKQGDDKINNLTNAKYN
jgi:hypothetical protein